MLLLLSENNRYSIHMLRLLRKQMLLLLPTCEHAPMPGPSAGTPPILPRILQGVSDKKAYRCSCQLADMHPCQGPARARRESCQDPARKAAHRCAYMLLLWPTYRQAGSTAPMPGPSAGTPPILPRILKLESNKGVCLAKATFEKDSNYC
jgi:hypothetical protein